MIEYIWTFSLARDDFPESEFHGAPDGPHVGLMDLAIWDVSLSMTLISISFIANSIAHLVPC